MKEQRLGRSVIVLIVFYLIACGVGFIINFQKGDLQAVGMGVVALLTPWIVPLLFHLLGLRMTQEVWVLDLVFVINFGLAVRGVAVATLIAQGISAVLSFMILMRKLKGYQEEQKYRY